MSVTHFRTHRPLSGTHVRALRQRLLPYDTIQCIVLVRFECGLVVLAPRMDVLCPRVTFPEMWMNERTASLVHVMFPTDLMECNNVLKHWWSLLKAHAEFEFLSCAVWFEPGCKDTGMQWHSAWCSAPHTRMENCSQHPCHPFFVSPSTSVHSPSLELLPWLVNICCKGDEQLSFLFIQ